MAIYPSIVNEVLKIMGFKSMNSNIPNSVIKDKNEENIIKILKKY